MAEAIPGGGIMGEHVRTHDWAATPLGPAETWPQSLRTALSIMLNSAFPTYLAWGPELTSFYNDAYIPIMGDKPNGIGRPFPEVWSEVWDTIGPITNRAMHGEASYFEDLPLTLMRRGHPEATWFSFSYSPIGDETGGVGGILCTVHETTERVRAETALRRSKARLQAAIDLVDVSPYTWDPATGALDWDARLKAMWGLSPEAPVSLDVWMSGIHPEDRTQVETALASCVDPTGDGVYHADYRVIGIEDGIERWISTHGQTTFENGQPVGFTGAALEITTRKRAEAALRESEERFRQFAENSSSTLWILNFKTMNLDYLSPAFESIWGEPREGVLGDPSRWNRILYPDDRERARGALEHVRLGEISTEEFRIIRQDGVVRWIRNTFFPIRDAQGQIRRAGGIAQDITRQDGRFVYVVDDEEATHRGLSHLLREAGYRVRVFSSGKSFLEAAPALAAGCVVLDICRSGAGGLVIPRELKARRIGLPVIVLGDANGDVTFGVQVMKAGAVDFLPVPYDSDQLLAAVASALASTHEEDEQNQEAERGRRRIAEMSEREREVLAGLLAGKTNKEIGRDIGLSPRTVETHRAHVMQRLGVQTLSQAVLVATSAGFESPSPGPKVPQVSDKPET
ncbi:PAS domain S-box protein [Microvirga calopogonii]|uniref:PAS domain S-box protein n=1 Tax=Microvirga calopogonii TaxID=2078013 RepID=UPI00197BE837|nr:PAS domain S-box protein [Microvirga calopogonii]